MRLCNCICSSWYGLQCEISNFSTDAQPNFAALECSGFTAFKSSETPKQSPCEQLVWEHDAWNSWVDAECSLLPIHTTSMAPWSSPSPPVRSEMGILLSVAFYSLLNIFSQSSFWWCLVRHVGKLPWLQSQIQEWLRCSNPALPVGIAAGPEKVATF